jgi:hypothetical protein
MRKTVNKIYQFKTIKTYKPEEIMAAGGATQWNKGGESTFTNFKTLKGLNLTDDEFQKALSMLTK